MYTNKIQLQKITLTRDRCQPSRYQIPEAACASVVLNGRYATLHKLPVAASQGQSRAGFYSEVTDHEFKYAE